LCAEYLVLSHALPLQIACKCRQQCSAPGPPAAVPSLTIWLYAHAERMSVTHATCPTHLQLSQPYRHDMHHQHASTHVSCSHVNEMQASPTYMILHQTNSGSHVCGPFPASSSECILPLAQAASCCRGGHRTTIDDQLNAGSKQRLSTVPSLLTPKVHDNY